VVRAQVPAVAVAVRVAAVPVRDPVWVAQAMAERAAPVAQLWQGASRPRRHLRPVNCHRPSKRLLGSRP
jgi:hypothetical protein